MRGAGFKIIVRQQSLTVPYNRVGFDYAALSSLKVAYGRVY